jgi:hypothetical protein
LNCLVYFILDTNQFTSTQTINITVKPSKTLLGFEWMVPEAFVQNKDYYYGCRNTYLFVQTRWQFVSGKLFTRICFSWYHTVTFTESVIIRTNIRVVSYSKYFTLIQTVIVINEIYFNQRKILVPKFTLYWYDIY